MVAAKGLALVLDFAAGPSCAAFTAAAAAASVPVVAYNLRPGVHRAAAAALAVPGFGGAKFARPTSDGSTRLKAILGIYHPLSLLKMLAKNLGIQMLMRFNMYMAEYLEHEKQAIAAEEQGQHPPEPPPLPDFKPVLDRGRASFVREVLVATVRRVYEHIAVARLPASKAEAILRDNKTYIKNVLSQRHKADPLITRLYNYQFATLHSSALFWAADTTVSIGYHTYTTYKAHTKSRSQKAIYWAKGTGLHLAKGAVVLVSASLGAAAGSAIKPGVGTLVGQVGAEITMSIMCATIISSVLEQ